MAETYSQDIIMTGDLVRVKDVINKLELPKDQTILDIALQDAVRYNKENIVDYLLDKGANPNYVNKFGETSLALAIQRGNDDIIKLLTERSAAQTVGTTSNSSSNSSSSGGNSNSSSSPVNLRNEIPTNDTATESNEPNPNEFDNAFGGRRRELKKTKKSRKAKKSKKSRKSKKAKKYTRRNA